MTRTDVVTVKFGAAESGAAEPGAAESEARAPEALSPETRSPEARSYDILVGQDLIAELGALLMRRFGRRRVFLITEDRVAAHWLAPVLAALEGAGFVVAHRVMESGEATKSFARLSEIIDWLLDSRVGRDGLVVALGGGVIGDLVGFAAAITLRGLDYIQLPTTLLAQVDSSVGGKTAINTPHGKNLVGSFHQPGLVVIDISVLKTLPPREMRAGYAEIVKYGLIGDAGFFGWLEAEGDKVLAGETAALQRAIVTSCQWKARIVGQDEREAGARALLNFGHTFGHALEAEGRFDGSLLHGEAVAVGMGLAFDLSRRLGLCCGADAGRARRHLVRAGLPADIRDIAGATGWQSPDLLAHMRHDKKVQGGQMRFILARKIGSAFVASGVDEALVAEILNRSSAAPDTVQDMAPDMTPDMTPDTA